MSDMVDHLAALDDAAATFSQVLRAGDVDAAVPSCPGWRVSDLVGHLGAVHRWATAVVAGGQAAERGPGPEDGEDLAVWFDQGAAGLLEVLGVTDPARPTWGFGPPPRLAAFWRRRQAHETAMHLVDLQLARGLAPHYPGALASDGIGEVAEVFFPRQVSLGRIAPLSRSLRLVPHDDPLAAVLLAGDGASTDAAAAGTPDATVTGPAEVLVRLLWGRTGLDDAAVEILGDPLAAAEVLGAGIVP